MISNSNRSGFVRVEPGEDRRRKPQDEVRSGRVSDKPVKEKKKAFGLPRKQKIKEIDGELRVVDI